MEHVIALSQEDIARVKETGDKLINNIGKVLVGKREAVELLLVALLCESHLLIEDVPGIGKTILAKAAAKSLECSFKRIQCTPDLLPSDVTGIHYFNQKNGEFEFRPGPIIANFVLVDEINRATPRTQSCLLECMQEQQVTVDLDTLPLPRPFMMLATQNPVELQGTFPLPEAQLDRFLMCLRLGYPDESEEQNILLRFQEVNPLDTLTSVVTGDKMLEIQKYCRRVYVDESVRSYIVALTRATRTHKSIELGASPRATLGLNMAAQALAAIRGRTYVIPDDVKYLAVPVLTHRLTAKPEARIKGRSLDVIVKEIIEIVPVPVEK